MIKRELFSRLLLVFAISLAIYGCSSSDQKKGATEPLKQLDPYSAPLYPAQKKAEARDFEVTLIDGEQFRLSDYRGKVVLLNIWATWCAPCHEETPEFVDLYEKYRDQGLVILGASIDEQGESVVRPFMEKYGVSYPIVIDKQNIILDKYGPTMSIPTTYIIGKDGSLKYFAVGALTKKELEPRLKDMLGV